MIRPQPTFPALLVLAAVIIAAYAIWYARRRADARAKELRARQNEHVQSQIAQIVATCERRAS